MSIRELFSEKCVTFDLKARSKQGAIDELIELLKDAGKLDDTEAFRSSVIKREEEFSTGIGVGIAVPHGRGNMVKETSIAFGKSPVGIDFQASDGEPVFLFFLLAVPESDSDTHLRALAEIARKLMHAEIREKLLNINTYEEFLNIWS